MKVTTIARKKNTKLTVARSDAVLDAILERLANGESLNKICSEPNMPTRKSIYVWLKADAVLRADYELAIAMRAEKMAEEIVDLADEQPPIDKDTGKMDGAWVTWQKLRVDARKWTISKLLPKKYGDRLNVEADVKTSGDEYLEILSSRARMYGIQVVGCDEHKPT